jgi:tRNA(adenine34) deaminase
MKNDEFWMREALAEARKTQRSAFNPNSETVLADDVPVGAICVLNGEIVGRGHNQRELLLDPTAHAEALCLREAAQTLNNSFLRGVTLYVTLEPCPMCAGAIWLSRVERVVFGAYDARAGACGSVFDVVRDPRLNHQAQLIGGVLEAECIEILQTFFEKRRGK